MNVLFGVNRSFLIFHKICIFLFLKVLATFGLQVHIIYYVSNSSETHIQYKLDIIGRPEPVLYPQLSVCLSVCLSSVSDIKLSASPFKDGILLANTFKMSTCYIF